MSPIQDVAAPVAMFWLKTGDVPAGPYSITQVHAEMAAGRATWRTPACPVGSGVWLPLTDTPGLGPAADPAAPRPVSAAASPASRQTAAAVPISPVTPAPSPVTTGAAARVGAVIGVGVAVAVVAAAAYGIYEWVRPLTATEVCKKIDEAKTAADAKKYATARMHPFLDYAFAQAAAADPNDKFDFTQEVDGPAPNTKRVGFTGSWFDQDAGGRIRVEGHFKMVKADGWKADDMVFTGVDGVSLAGPVSLVDQLRLAAPGAGPPAKPAGPRPASAPGLTFSDRPVPRPQAGPVAAFHRIKDAVGWGGIAAGVVLAVVGLSVREHMRGKSAR